jgi:hypothetical protein
MGNFKAIFYIPLKVEVLANYVLNFLLLHLKYGKNHSHV